MSRLERMFELIWAVAGTIILVAAAMVVLYWGNN